MSDDVSIRIGVQNARAAATDIDTVAKSVKTVGTSSETAGKQQETAAKRSRKFGSAVGFSGRLSGTALGPIKKLVGAVGALGAAYIGMHAAKDAVQTTVSLTKASAGLQANFGLSAEKAGELAASAEVTGVQAKALTTGLTMMSRSAEAARGQNDLLTAKVTAQREKLQKLGREYTKLGTSQSNHVARTKLATKITSENAKMMALNSSSAGKQAAAFRAVGVSQAMLKKGDTHAILRQVAQGLKDMPGSTKKAAIQMALLGRGAQNLRPLLKGGAKGLDEMGAKAKKYGAVIGGHTAAQVKKMVEAEHEQHFAMLGLKIALGQQLIPTLTKLSKKMTGFIGDARKGKGAGGALRDVYKDVGGVLGTVFGFLDKHKTTVKVMTLGIIGLTAATKIYGLTVKGVEAFVVAWNAVTGLLVGEQLALDAAMIANPIGLVVVGIVALIAIFVLAYKKIGWFHKAVDATWHGITAGVGFVVGFVRHHWKLLLAIMFAPFIALPIFVATHFSQIVGLVKSMPGKIAHAAVGMWDGIKTAFQGAMNWVLDHLRSIDLSIGPIKALGKTIVPKMDMHPFSGLPHLATGGTASAPGWSVVGEKGPELRFMPKGASIVPLRRPGARPSVDPQQFDPASMMGDSGVINLHSHLYLDGREVAESVARHTKRKRAAA